MTTPFRHTFAGDINAIRQNYDTSNPVIAEILKVKEERLKILQELNQENIDDLGDLFKNDFKKKKKYNSKKNRKSHPVSITSVRRSTRLMNSPNVTYKEKNICPLEPSKSSVTRPPNDYGAIPGVEVGTQWETRMECSLYGVHRPTVAGIHGGPDGAYSIALSGGYPEDIDEGDFFIYTGAGGRDLKGTSMKPKNLRVAPQTKDQQLEGTNLSLVKSIESKLPVRVIRGYKSPSVYAPETGYRYDGLYQVVKYWEDTGKTGFRIYRFKMERIKDQPLPPWKTILKKNNDEFKENIPPENNLDKNINSKEIKDVDEEIQKCIKFFCRAANIGSMEKLDKDNNDTEFHGWD